METPPAEVRRDLGPILAAFPRERQYLLTALQRVQAELGALPLWAIQAVGEHLRVPKSDIYGVATHFPELRLAPPGAHVVRVCTGLSCQVLGARELLAEVERRLGVRLGETRADGAATVEETTCAFICGVAPVVEVDGVAHGGLTVGDLGRLVERRVGNGVAS